MEAELEFLNKNKVWKTQKFERTNFFIELIIEKCTKTLFI